MKSLFLWLKYKVQHYVSFRCTALWFDICMCYKKINMVSNNYMLPYKVIYYYILPSMCLMLYVSHPWLTYFIVGGLYYLIPFTYFTHSFPILPSPLANFHLLSVFTSHFILFVLLSQSETDNTALLPPSVGSLHKRSEENLAAVFTFAIYSGFLLPYFTSEMASVKSHNISLKAYDV